MDHLSGSSGSSGSYRAAAWRFPGSHTFVLGNGLRVKLVDMPGRLVAGVAVAVDLPTAAEQPGAEGAVAAYASMMLADAPHARSGRVSAVARIGAVITTGCDHRGPKVMADCPVTDLPPLLDALADMLMRFEPTARSFEASRQRFTMERAFAERDPSARANKLLCESILAPDNRYARPVTGTEQSWREMTAQDVATLYERRVAPHTMTLVIVGDLRLLDAEAVVREAFAGHAARNRAWEPDQAPRPGGGPRLIWRPGPGGEQARIMLGSFAVDRLDPRWPSARVAAELLGAGPDALLNQELRGRLGITYGFDVRFVPYFSGGLFLVTGSVARDQAEPAVAAIRETLNRALGHGFDAALFDQVRDRMVGGAAATYETTLAVAQQHTELVSCGIDESFIDDHLDRLRALERSRMLDDVRELIDPDRLHATVVGPFDPDRSVLSGLERG